MRQKMIHPNSLMLLRIAQADAYGMAAEYLHFPRDKSVREAVLDFNGYVAHPTHGHKPGQYTDDTQMSIAVSEVLLEGWLSGTNYFMRLQFADAFVRAFRRDPRKGYSRRFQEFLESHLTLSGKDFLQNIKSHSDKNGAAMRAVPLGVLSSIEEVIRTARTNASLTHDTPWGYRSSILVALLSHFALYTDEPFHEFGSWCCKMNIDQIDSLIDLAQLQAMLDIQWNGPVRGSDQISVAQATVHAVLHLLSRRDGLRSSMLQAVRWGGDVDSVIAITWGIQSARVCEPLPQWFETGLEDGPFGRRFLVDLGTQLMNKYSG